MKDAIKMISLDDVADLGQPVDKTQAKDVSKDQQRGAEVRTGNGTMTHVSTSDFQPMGTNSPLHFRAKTEEGSALYTTSSFIGSVSKLGGATGLTSMTASRLYEIFGGSNSSQKRRIMLMSGGLLLLLVAFYFFSQGGDEAGTEAFTSPNAASEQKPSETTAEKSGAEGKGEAAMKAAATTPSETALAAEPASATPLSPYDRLPNPLGVTAAEDEKLSSEQETRWRNGLSHPFSYQKFKAVQEARQSHLKGSEYILNDALAQPKFWTRMEALLGMAELGQEIDGETMRTAIGDARPSLVANYFRRFAKTPAEAHQHVMRVALSAAPPPARLVILENLTPYRGPITDLYFVAASRDSDPKVQEFAARALAAQPVAEDLKAQYEQYQSGALQIDKRPQTKPKPETLAAPAAKEAPPVPTPGLSPLNVKDMKVEELPNDVNVEEVYFLDGEGAKNGNGSGSKASESPGP